ncbi:MAG TPA: MFS transporter [Trebonia sp.]|nr:MFS transporter [Trebonia sp.]
MQEPRRTRLPDLAPDLAQAGPAGEAHEYVLTPRTLIAAALSVCLAQIALAIPAVLNGLFQQDLSPTSSQLTWISDAFLVPITLLELNFGALGDLFGRKRLLVGGAIVVAIGEVIGILAPGASATTGTRVLVLWIGQIVAGVGAAAVFPTSLAMVAAGTHTPRARARSIAIWAAALSAGNMLSPVIGGLTASHGFGSDPTGGWRWSLIVVAGLALVTAAGSALLARNSSAPAGRSLDWAGQATIAVALFALLFAVIQAPTSGWGSTEVIAAFIIAAVFLVLFVSVERRVRAPLLRLQLFRNRAFAVAAIVTVIGMFSFLGTAYSTSIRLSSVQGFTPLRTSIAFLLLNGIALILMPVTSRVLERYDPRWGLGGGLLLIGAGDLWAAALSPDASLSMAVMVAPLALVGIGFALAISTVTAVAVDTVPNHLAGMASGTTNMLRDFGFTLGPAVIGAIALSRAAAQIQAKLAASASLRSALATFNGAAGHAPVASRPAIVKAIGAVNSGPLGANSVPATVARPGGGTMAFNPLKEVAFQALAHAFALGYLVSGVCALVAALLALTALGRRRA